MAEKEYIEREALLGIFDAAISHLRDRAGGDGILLASIGLVQNSRDLVAKFPTADVVEVRHGVWIWTENGTEDYEQYWICSCCGDKDYIEYNYCPHCGAKMGGGKDND